MHHAAIAVIGGGNMARAIVEGCLRAGVLGAEEWSIAEPDRERREWFGNRGIATAESAGALAGTIGPETQVLLAVKPQVLGAVAREGAGLVWSDRIVISILAGTPTAGVRAALGVGSRVGPRVVRAMPNLPASIGEGATAVALGAGARPGDEALAVRVFGGIGPVVERLDEGLMDAFTAVAGSGPAYLFYLAEAMIRSAVALGFEAATADRVVRQTLAGAALLQRGSPEAPASLRSAVTSKGGTTEAALSVLNDAGVMGALERAVAAAERRGRELGRAEGAAGA